MNLTIINGGNNEKLKVDERKLTLLKKYAKTRRRLYHFVELQYHKHMDTLETMDSLNIERTDAKAAIVVDSMGEIDLLKIVPDWINEMVNDCETFWFNARLRTIFLDMAGDYAYLDYKTIEKPTKHKWINILICLIKTENWIERNFKVRYRELKDILDAAAAAS